MIAVVGWTGPCEVSSEEIGRSLILALDQLPHCLKPRQSSVRGRPRTCWQTVEEQVRRAGGRAVPGWSVVDAEPRFPQSNPLARVTLNAHCVWEYQGQLWETIEERESAVGFIPASPPTHNAGVEFFDDDADPLEHLPWMSLEFEVFTYELFRIVDLTSSRPEARQTQSPVTCRTHGKPRLAPGRNSPCPCGSGRKTKRCCGRGH